MNAIEKFKKVKIVPVVVLEDTNDALPLAKALLEGGINVMEITFRSACAKDCIKIIADNVADMFVGAGTILNADQALSAIEAGAKFIVSPGFDLEIVKVCQSKSIPVIQGAITPTEIMKVIEAGLDIVKFFPAGDFGGLKTIKSLSAPFKNISFMPTGSVNINNLKDYLSFDKIVAVGGSWVCDPKLIKARDWPQITQLCIEALKVASEVRN